MLIDHSDMIPAGEAPNSSLYPKGRQARMVYRALSTPMEDCGDSDLGLYNSPARPGEPWGEGTPYPPRTLGEPLPSRRLG
jgi:hypothetical protein